MNHLFTIILIAIIAALAVRLYSHEPAPPVVVTVQGDGVLFEAVPVP